VHDEGVAGTETSSTAIRYNLPMFRPRFVPQGVAAVVLLASLLPPATASAQSTIVASQAPAPPKPDAVFPNNWISFHGDGTVVLYPMQAESR